MVTSDVTVYIGRFSPFHLGHVQVLTQALTTSKLVIIMIGSSGQARSLKNPFSFDERRHMVMGWLNKNADKVQPIAPNLPVILPLKDQPYNDTAWIQSVQEAVNAEVNKCTWSKPPTISIIGSDRDESTWYLKAFPQWDLSLVPPYCLSASPGAPSLSATSIREMMYSTSKQFQYDSAMSCKVPESTYDFLRCFVKYEVCSELRKEHEHIKQYKASWEAAPYPPIFVTTDSVVIQSGHVLVVERAAFPGKGLWALPGGFLNQNESLKDGAIRELIEETGISLAEGKRAKELTKSILQGSIVQKEIFDKPDRSARGRTITTAFLFQLDDTKPLPRVKGQNAPLSETDGAVVVETANAFWIPISVALSNSDRWFEDHLAIIEYFTRISGNR